jgi:predicted ATP-grasp superfamily ATP-dependent carboligase
VPLARFVDYGRWFQEHAVTGLERRRVARVCPEPHGFRVELDDGEPLRAKRVVVAAGIVPFAWRPPQYAGLPPALVSHTVDHRDLGVFGGRRVAVIGGGQSALESAALLAEAGAEVEVLVREHDIRWLPDEDGADPRLLYYANRKIALGGPRSAWLAAWPGLFRRLPDRVHAPMIYRFTSPRGAGWLKPRQSGVPITTGRSVGSASPRGDELVLATGFESSVRGLHFLGAPATRSFGPVMNFVCGTWASARGLTRAVVGRRAPRASHGEAGPRVLVTDAKQRSALAACRGLAAAGYRVSTVADERFALGHWSRFSEERITLTGPEVDPGGYVERLSQVLRRGGYALVMPGSELSLALISEHRDLIEPYARLGLPPHEVVLRTLDKPLLCDQAAAVREFAFPLIIKPVRSITWTDGRTRHVKCQVVEDATAFKAAIAAVGVPLTLQEYVAGTTIVPCAAVRVDGRLLGLTFARYARTYPSRHGSAALATTIAPPRQLIQQIKELLELIGWCGIFELELLELGENRFGAIAFNPRPFGWMALAIGAGANLPALWCDHVLGRHSASPNGARVGIRYRWEDGDIRNALEELSRGRLRSAAAELRPYRRVVPAHFRIDDPAPLIARMLSLAQNVSFPKPGCKPFKT